MNPKWHILYGAIFSVLIYYLFKATPLQVSIIFLSSVLIDLDHYARYFLIKKDLNPKSFWNWSMKGTNDWLNLTTEQRFSEYKLPIYIFHGIEFWLILAISSYFFPVLIWALIGISFHMVLDFIDIYQKKFPFYFKFSQAYIYLTNKNKKQLEL